MLPSGASCNPAAVARDPKTAAVDRRLCDPDFRAGVPMKLNAAYGAAPQGACLAPRNNRLPRQMAQISVQVGTCARQDVLNALGICPTAVCRNKNAAFSEPRCRRALCLRELHPMPASRVSAALRPIALPRSLFKRRLRGRQICTRQGGTGSASAARVRDLTAGKLTSKLSDRVAGVRGRQYPTHLRHSESRIRRRKTVVQAAG